MGSLGNRWKLMETNGNRWVIYILPHIPNRPQNRRQVAGRGAPLMCPGPSRGQGAPSEAAPPGRPLTGQGARRCEAIRGNQKQSGATARPFGTGCYLNLKIKS